MDLRALALVVMAAGLHATWNALAKRTPVGGIAFVWLTSVVATVLYAPVALVMVVLQPFELGGRDVLVMAGSGLLHAAYLLALQRGYARGDLSVVYPVARGLGPLLAVGGAVVLLGERPSGMALLGGLIICIGVFVLGAMGATPTRNASRDPSAPAARNGVGYALLTGVAIASYTLWDARAVAILAAPPLVFHWGSNLARSLLLMPLAYRMRSSVALGWHSSRKEVVGVSVLGPLAYILVLVAFTLAPISYVAPAREISIVFGTLIGVRLFAEGRVVPRLAAAVGICAGVGILATY